MLVVGGHEHHLRPVCEACQDSSQRHSVQTGHLDVAEHYVDRSRVQGAQSVGPVGCGPDVTDPAVMAQQVGQLGQCRGLVVNHQGPQTGPGLSRLL